MSALTIDDFPPISDLQSKMFDALVSGAPAVLMSVMYEGRPTVVICAVEYPDEDHVEVDLRPVYLAVDDAIFAKLTPPIASEGGDA